MISGCNAHCLTLIFLCLALLYLLSILALGLFSLSCFLSGSLNIVDFAIPFSLIMPRSLLSFRFVRPFVPLSPLSPLSFGHSPLSSSSSPVWSECSPKRPIWRHRTKCVKAWRDPQRHTAHTHTHLRSILSAYTAFLTFQQGGSGRSFRISIFYIMKFCSISGGWI